MVEQLEQPDSLDRPLAGRSRLAAVLSGTAAIAVLAVITWFLSYQQFRLAEPRYASNFYDAQVRSWFAGTWSMPQEVLGLEGIRTDGGLQMYFGPFPSLLRVPVLFLTDRFDGRLTQPSMLLAYVIFLAATTALWWQIRSVARSPGPITRGDGVAAAVMLLVVGTGSVALLPAAAAQVYSEALIWGLALAMSSFTLLLSALRSFRWVTALGAMATATAAALSRVGAGGGALAAIWIVAGIWFLGGITEAHTGRLSRGVRRLVTYVVPTLRTTSASTLQCAAWIGGAVAGAAAYVTVNHVRFGTLVTIPWERFIFSDLSVHRAEALAANGGSLTGVHFLPTTLWAYLRPDGVSFSDRFPWITFPIDRVTPVGDVVLDVTPITGSLTATMPLALALAAVGIVAVLLGRRGRTAEIGVLRPLVMGAGVGVMPILLAGFFAHRYMVDALPLIIVGAFAGLQVLWDRLLATPRAAVRAVALAVAAGLALWSIAVNLALTLDYQKLQMPLSPDVRYEFVTRQLAGMTDVPLLETDTVPAPAHQGSLLAIGDCEALLWSNGQRWFLLEGSLTKEAWRPDPNAKFFDQYVAGPIRAGEAVLCKDLRRTTEPDGVG